ncbi:MAG: hypothetical protein NDI61_04120 [Bdellovibrionaceae bacterium]|nr:hypothetical protein [Pseudobdellovibrionaceae bacterium]
MNGFSVFKTQTGVVRFVFSAVLIVSTASLYPRTTMSADAIFTPDPVKTVEAANLACEELRKAHAEASAQDPKMPPFDMYQCKQEKLLGSAGSASFNACQSALTRMEDARQKYLDKCDAAGLSAQGCYSRATTCQGAIMSASKSLSYDEEEELDEEDSAQDCKDRYSTCPALASLSLKGLRERRTDVKDDHKSEQENVFDLEEKLRDEQQGIMDAQNEMMQAQVKSQQAEARAMRELEKAAIQADAEKAAKLQALRKKYEEIDQAYLQLRNDLNKASVAVNMQADAVQLECEKKAEDLYQRLLAKKKAGRAAGTNNQGSTTRLAGSDKRRAREVRMEYMRCMTMKSTRNKLARIEEMRTVELKRAMDTQAVLEQNRANTIQSMNETEILDKLARETATKHMVEQLKEAKNATAMAVQQSMQAMQTKQQNLSMLQQRIVERKDELKNVTFEKKLVDRDLKCATKYSSTTTSTDKDISFSGAVSALSAFESACSTYKTVCAKVSGVSLVACGAEVTEYKKKEEPLKTNRTKTTD